MIIYADKHYMKCDDFPDTDFIGDADYVLDDNTDAELEAKIISLYPNFEFVFDGEKIVDVVATEPQPEPPAPPTNAELAAAIAELAEVIFNG